MHGCIYAELSLGSLSSLDAAQALCSRSIGLHCTICSHTSATGVSLSFTRPPSECEWGWSKQCYTWIMRHTRSGVLRIQNYFPTHFRSICSGCRTQPPRSVVVHQRLSGQQNAAHVSDQTTSAGSRYISCIGVRCCHRRRAKVLKQVQITAARGLLPPLHPHPICLCVIYLDAVASMR